MKTLAHALSPLLIALPLLLSGCEKLGIDDPAKVAADKEAEGKAIGAACRNAGRGLEDCYQKNPKAVKSAIFAGWKDMNEYMSQNKMDVIPPPPPPPPKAPPKVEEESDKSEADKPGSQSSKAAKHG